MLKDFFLLGDIHGDWDYLKRCLRYYLKLNGSTDKKGAAIQLGDFGLGFRNYWEEFGDLCKLSDYLKEKNFDLYVIRGNHDNPIFWKKDTFNFTNIHFVKDNSIIEIGDKRFFCSGGAISIDRILRQRKKIQNKELQIYWEDECIETFDYTQINWNEIDFILTHTAPISFFPSNIDNPLTNDFIRGFNPGVQVYEEVEKLISDLNAERKFYEDMKNYIESVILPDKQIEWFYGHFHLRHNGSIGKRINYKLLNIGEFFKL